MSNITSSLYNIRLLDDLSKKETLIHELHPLIKVLCTLAYLVAVVSVDRYEIMNLLPFALYPILIFNMGELPVGPIMKKILIVEPFIIGIGILNPFFDQHMIVIEGISFSRGWVTFLSIVIKSGLTVTASILLIATTGMDKLGAALRMMKVPKIFVLQLLLTYRYISVLIEEVSRMQRAYTLRSPNQKGVHWRVWGSFAGQLMLRTFDRAQRVYQSMSLRHFDGEYNVGVVSKIRGKELAYLIGWCAFFIIVRMYHIPMLIGSIVIGVIK